jgi:hypothetical protein
VPGQDLGVDKSAEAADRACGNQAVETPLGGGCGQSGRLADLGVCRAGVSQHTADDRFVDGVHGFTPDVSNARWKAQRLTATPPILQEIRMRVQEISIVCVAVATVVSGVS